MENKIAQDQKNMKVESIATSFFFFSFPDHVTQDDLWKVFAKYGEVVDVYVSMNLNKFGKTFGKRFGFVKFINIGDVHHFVTLLNTIWIGSFKLRVRLDARKSYKCSVMDLEKGVKITTEDQKKRSYADLPKDVLLSIADRLTSMDVLSLHCTCKDFRSASLIEFSTPPWLVFNGMYTSFHKIIGYDKDSFKTYYAKIPDLIKGALVVISSGHPEWLLVFKGKSIFFLSMSSKNFVRLPDFHHKFTYRNHVVGFSDIPTSSHCVVCIFNRIMENWDTEVSVICKGQRAWTQHKIHTTFRSRWNELYTAKFDHESQTFYYIDGFNQNGLKVSSKDEKWIPFVVEKIDTSVNFPNEVVSCSKLIYETFIGYRACLGI